MVSSEGACAAYYQYRRHAVQTVCAPSSSVHNGTSPQRFLPETETQRGPVRL